MTNIATAERAATNLRKAAQSFRDGTTEYARKRVHGSMDMLSQAGESAFAERGFAITGYMLDMPEAAALVCERFADEVDALIAGGHIE